jgi:Putative adhesin
MENRMHPRVRKSAYLMAIAILLTLIATKVWSQTPAPQVDFQRSFTVSPEAKLVVENYKGTIHVTGTDSNQVVVDVRKIFEGNDADRKWWLENLKVDVNGRTDRVEVKVTYPSQNCSLCWTSGNYESEVDLDIKVPHHIDIQLDGYKPDIRVSSTTGSISIHSYKAPMLLDSTTGAVHINTYKDSIRLRDVTLQGDLVIESIKADTEITAKNVGKNINIQTEKGTITLSLPANADFNLDYQGGRRASFTSDFPAISGATYSDQNMKGTVNHGGPNVRLRTDRGSVSLRKL